MMDRKQEFLKRILATFRIEAEENINNISTHLLELEKGCSDARKEEILEVIYRAAHSMKGASRAVNLSEIESICHALEDVMSAIRSQTVALTPDVIDLFTETVDLLNDILFENDGVVNDELSDKIERVLYALSCAEQGEAIKISKSKPKPVTVPSTPVVREDVENLIPKKEVEQPKPKIVKKETKRTTNSNTAKPVVNDTIRVSTKKLDDLLIQAEEMLNLKLISRQRIKDLQGVLSRLSLLHRESSLVLDSYTSVSVYLKNLEETKRSSNFHKEVAKVLQFSEWSSSYINEIEKEIKVLYNNSKQEDHSTSSLVKGLLDDVKEVITVPFSVLLDGFPKMVRDIARDLEKKVDFTVEGDNIEIDRRILETLRAPLMHILRNSLDYGIENLETRIKNGKPEKGHITFKVEQLENNKVEILISDDGPGLNKEKLKNLYIKNENISDDKIDSIPEADYLNYIFRSGISTSDIVTDLSGRGLGLAIVQDAIDKMEGSIVVESVPGESTTFRILLPISILTFRGVVIKACDRNFIAPTSKVKSVIRVKSDEIKTIENKTTVLYDGELIAVVELGKILELPAKDELEEYTQLIVLEVQKKRFALVVNIILGEQEVLVKKFNKQLKRVRNIAGATVLGSGEVVPILNVYDLYESMLGNSGVANSRSKGKKGETKKTKQNILVVEDSITSRTLIKNVLETRGYNVTTAIDGLDGYTKLREIVSFDCVISDVEMPRMSGFELTAKIRETKGFEDIPVILVTSLSKREDRERGIDVGANAYIIKSNFEQNNLFEVLDTLI